MELTHVIISDFIEESANRNIDDIQTLFISLFFFIFPSFLSFRSRNGRG